MKYWLMKSEPDCFSIDDLAKSPNKTSGWDGVRNYQARNFIKQMQIGDQMFFYHSNCKPPGIIGIGKIVSNAYPDLTAQDCNNEHYDPKSTTDNPRWFMVDVQFSQKFPDLLSLDTLKQYPELQNMPLVRKGNRLSVLPIEPEEWNFITNFLIKED